ncbi:MAG: HAD family hydrolase [Chloroflexota bacterium]|nr:HAD family hydrolase [Chloroflexota bacterium]
MNQPRFAEILLFDFEGTLVDFQWDLKNGALGAKQELERLGFPASAWQDNYAVLWNTAISTAKEHGLDKQAVAQRINAIYERYDQDALSRWSLRPNVKAVLSFLKNEKQLKLGLVTNIGRKAIDAACAQFELAGLFDVVVTRNDVELLKPNGAGIRRAIEKWEGDAARTLFVGDSVTDILAARDARVPVAIILGGEHGSDAARLTAAQPTWLWRSITELKEAILAAKTG